MLKNFIIANTLKKQATLLKKGEYAPAGGAVLI